MKCEEAIMLLEQHGLIDEAAIFRRIQESRKEPEPTKGEKVKWVKWRRGNTGVDLRQAVKDYDERFGA